MTTKSLKTDDEKELRLLGFLRYLFGELNLEYKSMSITEKVKEYDVPNGNYIPNSLVELGYLLKSGNGVSSKYKWNKEMGTSLKDANAILEHCRSLARAYSKSKYQKDKPTSSISGIAKNKTNKDKSNIDVKKIIEKESCEDNKTLKNVFTEPTSKNVDFSQLPENHKERSIEDIIDNKNVFDNLKAIFNHFNKNGIKVQLTLHN